MTPSWRPTWREIAAVQDGVLARWQALSGGMTKAAWDWRLERRTWQSPLPGIAVLHTGVLQPRELRWVAVLHAGKGAVLCGDAALVERGLKRLTPAALDVGVPRGRNIRAATTADGVGVEPHRLVMRPEWSTLQRELPTAKSQVAVLQAAAWVDSDREAELRLAMAVQQKVTAVPLVRATLAEMRKHPRRLLVLDVLDDIELGAHALSELDFLRFCRQHGLPEPDSLQLAVRAGGMRYLDGYYRAKRLCLEVDGAHHASVEVWNADTLRSLHLAVAARGTGEQLVRLTQANLRHDGAEVARLLRQLLL